MIITERERKFIQEIVASFPTAVPRLVNEETHREYLEGKPHRIVMGDIACYYTIPLSCDVPGIAGLDIPENSNPQVIVTDNLLTLWGGTEEDLYQIATGNLSHNINIRPLNEMLKEMGFLSEEFDFIPYVPMVLVSNKNLSYGAAQILSTTAMKKVSDTWFRGGSFAVIPSSVNEIIAIPLDDMDGEAMARMIMEVNHTEVEPFEKLSDHPLWYDRVDGKVKVRRF